MRKRVLGNPGTKQKHCVAPGGPENAAAENLEEGLRQKRSVQASEVNAADQKSDPAFMATPRYWVPASACSLPDQALNTHWYLGFRDIVNPNNATANSSSTSPLPRR